MSSFSRGATSLAVVNSTAHKVVSQLRKWTLIEGVSFLLLLFVAMPLKYFAGLPLAVKVVGMAHGVLFLVVGALLVMALFVAKWPLGRAAFVFLSTLVPFGPFLIDRRLKSYEAEAVTK